MNSKFRLILLAIGLVTVVGLLVLLAPKALGFYYQVEGGQQLDSVMNSLSDVPDIDLACVELPREPKNLRPKIVEAVNLFERALAYDSRNAQANLDLGRSYCLLGDPAMARDYYKAYTGLRPKNPLGHLGLGFAQEALGEAALAVEAWQAADMTVGYFLDAGNKAFQLENNEDALRWFERATWVGPGEAKPWLSLGEAYDQLGQAEQALEAYQTAWDIDPALSTTALTDNLKDRGDYPAVEKVLIQTLNTYIQAAGRLNWWRTLGQALREQEKWAEAAVAYQNALIEFPNQPELHAELGWVYYDRGDGPEPAREEFERAIELNDKSGDGYYALARLLAFERNYDEAEKYYIEAVQRAPQNRWYLLRRADNLRQAGKLDESISLYLEIIDRFPAFGTVYYELAQAYRLSEQSQKAIVAIEQALELGNPPLDTFYERAGQIYRSAGLQDKAIQAFRMALVLNPENEKAQTGLIALGEQ